MADTYPKCGVCGRRKKPVGRDLHGSAWDSFCTPAYRLYDPGEDGCPGYWDAPKPVAYWPSETDESKEGEDG